MQVLVPSLPLLLQAHNIQIADLFMYLDKGEFCLDWGFQGNFNEQLRLYYASLRRKQEVGSL